MQFLSKSQRCFLQKKKIHPKLFMDSQGTQIAKTVLKKSQTGGLRTYYKDNTNQNSVVLA